MQCDWDSHIKRIPVRSSSRKKITPNCDCSIFWLVQACWDFNCLGSRQHLKFKNLEPSLTVFSVIIKNGGVVLFPWAGVLFALTTIWPTPGFSFPYLSSNPSFELQQTPPSIQRHLPSDACRTTPRGNRSKGQVLLPWPIFFGNKKFASKFFPSDLFYKIFLVLLEFQDSQFRIEVQDFQISRFFNQFQNIQHLAFFFKTPLWVVTYNRL